MTNEIKEILDDLRTYKDRYEYFLFNNLSFSDRDYKAKIILDYITNLQEENKRLNNIIDELEKELKEGSFDVYFCSTSLQKTFKSNEIIIKAMILDKLKELKGSDE